MLFCHVLPEGTCLEMDQVLKWPMFFIWSEPLYQVEDRSSLVPTIVVKTNVRFRRWVPLESLWEKELVDMSRLKDDDCFRQRRHHVNPGFATLLPNLNIFFTCTSRLISRCKFTLVAAFNCYRDSFLYWNKSQNAWCFKLKPSSRKNIALPEQSLWITSGEFFKFLKRAFFPDGHLKKQTPRNCKTFHLSCSWMNIKGEIKIMHLPAGLSVVPSAFLILYKYII